jgi:CheY-like chemotaxis protein
MQGEIAGLYEWRFGLALMVFVSIAVFVVLVAATAASLHRVDLRRQAAEAAVARSAARLAILRAIDRAIIGAQSPAAIAESVLEKIRELLDVAVARTPPVARPLSTEVVALPPPDSDAVTILVADDNAVNQTVIRRMLHKRGCHVDVVTDGDQAVRDVLASVYDLVFMDCHMPVMDGFEATRALRTTGCRVPIIAFTAAAIADNRERCTAAGMDDCITKPVTGEALADMLERWTGPASSVRRS